jgi:hypothetical protein
LIEMRSLDATMLGSAVFKTCVDAILKQQRGRAVGEKYSQTSNKAFMDLNSDQVFVVRGALGPLCRVYTVIYTLI